MNRSRWAAVAVVLLAVTPVLAGGEAAGEDRAGEDLATFLEDWSGGGDAMALWAEPAPGGPELAVLSESEEKVATPWRFHLTFYLWATSLDATSTIDGQSADLELSFSDIFDEVLQGAFSSRFEAWKGEFGLIANFDWMSLGKGIEVVGPGPIGQTANVDVEVEQIDFFLGAAWRFAGDPVSAQPIESGFFGDLYAGGRYTSLRQEVEVRGGGGLLNRDLGGTESWIEPVIGARLGYHINDWFTVMARGDAGGFGLSGLPERHHCPDRRGVAAGAVDRRAPRLAVALVRVLDRVRQGRVRPQGRLRRTVAGSRLPVLTRRETRAAPDCGFRFRTRAP